MTVAEVRPGFFGWPTFWLLYAAAGNLGAMAATVVLVLPLVALGDSPAQPVLAVVGIVLWLAAVVLAVRWAHPKIVRFIDRAHFRLTADHLYLGRGDRLTVDLRDVTDAVVRGGTDFMSALISRLEPVLREGEEMPWGMRELTGPADVNWVYGPDAPQLPKGSRMPNWTFL